jgi:hypothetical protein
MAEPIPIPVPQGSPEPRIRVTRHFTQPFATILTAARTCYSSKGLIEDADLRAGGDRRRPRFGEPALRFEGCPPQRPGRDCEDASMNAINDACGVIPRATQ